MTVSRSVAAYINNSELQLHICMQPLLVVCVLELLVLDQMRWRRRLCIQEMPNNSSQPVFVCPLGVYKDNVT